MGKVDTQEDVFLKKENGVATLYINRPEKRNAFHIGMWKGIGEAVADVSKDVDLKVLVISGVDESAFSAGADIGEFQTIRYSAEGAKSYNDQVQAVEENLKALPIPTISLIRGYCIGGGLELALACDLRFAARNSQFGITPANLGLIYNLSPTKNLMDLVGPARAKDILFSGRKLQSEEAYHYGLIEHLYEDDEIVEKTYAYAEQLTTKAQRSVKGSKEIIHAISQGAIEESREIAQMILDSFESEDYREGVGAFLEKRPPKFREI